MRYLNLRHSQVILDPDNPRLPDGTSSDREAINRLLDDGADALINLARDMAQSGQTNPAELPIAIKSGPKYLILEGNRRFAALKLLRDPALADDAMHQRAFRRAAALGTPPNTVYTLVASSREEAEHWIVLRHTGENSGVGVKRWSAGQTATHRRRVNKTVDAGTLRSITIADELEEAYAIDEEIVDLVRTARREKLTNIGRFFSPDVLSALFLAVETDDTSSIRERTLWAHHDAAQLRDLFAWALRYIVENPVDAYKNSSIRNAALRSVPHLLPSLATAADAPRRLSDSPLPSVRDLEEPSVSDSGDPSAGVDMGDEEDSVSPGSGNAKAEAVAEDKRQAVQGKKKGEAKPQQYLFQRLRLPNHNERVQRLLKECRSLSLEDVPGVACVMARVIVELSVSSPEVLSLSGAQEQNSLKHKIVSMLRYLDPDIEHGAKRDRQLAQAYLEASELGVQYLHGFVHNPDIRPDPHLARRFSEAFGPFLERIDGEI